ncbi:hypothetical protein [Citrobacter koseri]|uniref:hypothetical protein n=1 Tax=Citrobacter koseri TaxID=545 RepID=UPI000E11B843|nr:hypothetical protein [Citrobacter koseri]SUX61205.1 Uncharacterised protein [Citrobacter koseri]
MSNKTGGQAFPKQQWEYDGQNNVLQYQEDGMTLRDYFAAKAMNGMCSHVDTWGMTVPQIAKRAYELADEMLRAREAS